MLNFTDARRARATFGAALFIMLGLATVARADPSFCPMVPDAAQRLACYDRENGRKPDTPAPAKPDAAASEFKPIDLTDLKTNIAEMRGRKVEVAGRVALFASMVMLAAPDSVDTSPVMVDIQQVPRDQRRAIVERCQRFCEAVVRGIVVDVMMRPGLIGASIVLRPGT